MVFIRNDRVLFSEGFLHIGGVIKTPEIIYRERTLGDLTDTQICKLANMTLSELTVIGEIVYQ